MQWHEGQIMNAPHVRQARQLRIGLTLLVFVAELAHLAWEYFHGGIVSHHFLNRADMPAVSNLWGALLLPALSWVLSGIALRPLAERAPSGARLAIGFFGPLLFAAALAASFVAGKQDISSLLLQAMLLLALVFRVYRAECVLGFILGMTVTFGAVLPAVIGSGIAALSAAVHLLLYPCVLRVWRWLTRAERPD